MATVVVVGLMTSACGGTSDAGAPVDTISRANQGVIESADKPETGGALVYGLIAETNGWNPGSNQWAASGLEVAFSIFDPIAAFDERSEVRPYLASAFNHNADFTEWSVDLREGVTFHNGKPVTAEAVARNQKYFQQSPITGGAYELTEDIVATDADTVTFTFTQPFVLFPAVLTTQVGVVADPDWLESNDGLTPIGSGPFVFDEWKQNDSLTVTKNPDYWRADADGTPYPYLDEVEFRVVTNDDIRASALRAGDIDMMQTYAGLQVESFQGDADYQIFSDPGGETPETFVQLNTQAPPFDDVDARRALAYATNKDEIIQIMTGGYNQPANGPYAPESPWFSESAYPQYDPAKAAELATKVRAAHGGEFRFKLISSPDVATQQMQQVLQQQWAAAGIDVELSVAEQARVIIDVVTGQYQAATWTQFGSAHPVLETGWWSAEQAFAPPRFTLNFSRIDDAPLDAALKAAVAAEDPTVFDEQFAIVQERLADQVPFVWLYHGTIAVIGTNRVVNMVNWTLPDGTPGLEIVQGSHPLAQVWMKGL